jgi:hypothetical protein
MSRDIDLVVCNEGRESRIAIVGGECGLSRSYTRWGRGAKSSSKDAPCADDHVCNIFTCMNFTYFHEGQKISHRVAWTFSIAFRGL